MKNKHYSVIEKLPRNGQKCICYGHKTYCCKCDMETADWHEVTFEMNITSYRFKKQIPEDKEESVLESYTVSELWLCDDECHVIAVTHWYEGG